MSRRKAQRLFLERRTYRRNRLQDAARLLPVLGAGLCFGPVFIRGDGSEGPGLADWLVYFFVIWIGLILVTALVSRALEGEGPNPGEATPEGAPAGADPDRGAP